MNMSLNNISKGNYAKRIHCGYDDSIGFDLSISSSHVRDKRNGLLGRYKFTKEYLNCTSDVVLVAERTGIVVPLYPTPEYVAERYKITPVMVKAFISFFGLIQMDGMPDISSNTLKYSMK